MTRLKVAIALMLAAAGPALAQDDAAELAKKLSNPVAALISVPMQPPHRYVYLYWEMHHLPARAR